MKFSKKKSLVLPMKNTRLTTTPPPPPPSSLPSPLLPPPGFHSKRPRVCLYHAHMLKTHVRVVPAYTGFSACHTPHTPHTTPQPTTTTRPPHHTETERRGDEREEGKRIEERREKREDPFSVWWCMAVFCWCSDFLVDSVCARDLSLLNSVKYDSFLEFSAPWPVNSFFLISANLFFYAVTVFIFF